MVPVYSGHWWSKFLCDFNWATVFCSPYGARSKRQWKPRDLLRPAPVWCNNSTWWPIVFLGFREGVGCQVESSWKHGASWRHDAGSFIFPSTPFFPRPFLSPKKIRFSSAGKSLKGGDLLVLKATLALLRCYVATSFWIGCCVLRWKLMQPSAYRRRQVFQHAGVRGFCLSGRVDVQVIYWFKQDLVGENSLNQYAMQLKLWKNHILWGFFSKVFTFWSTRLLGFVLGR